MNTILFQVTTYPTYYKSQIFPRELDTDKPLEVRTFELPHEKCVEYPHLLGNVWFPAVESALKPLGAFPIAYQVGYSFGLADFTPSRN